MLVILILNHISSAKLSENSFEISPQKQVSKKKNTRNRQKRMRIKQLCAYIKREKKKQNTINNITCHRDTKVVVVLAVLASTSLVVLDCRRCGMGYVLL